MRCAVPNAEARCVGLGKAHVRSEFVFRAIEAAVKKVLSARPGADAADGAGAAIKGQKKRYGRAALPAFL